MASVPEQVPGYGPTSLVHELIDAATRDITAWLDESNPNRRAAGRAALTSLDAAIRALRTVRERLARDLAIGRTT
jgi:hypothetical protein